MSVNTSTGLVQDPFGVAPLAQMLGLATTDVTTVCCGGTLSDTDRINPFSLIRPLFRKSDTPGTLPSWFANSSNYKTSKSLVIPAAHQGRIIDNQKISTSGLPCVKDYEYTSAKDAYFSYEIMKWGFLVPYVVEPYGIFALRDLVWERFGPRDSARNSDGSLKECWAELMHFDGYQHKAEPVDPMLAVVMEYGEKISYTPTPPKIGAWKDSEVLGTNGKKNPGGVVSIPAVFPSMDGYYYGATLYRRAPNEKYFRYIKSTKGALVGQTDPSGKLPILNAVDFGSQILSQEGEYILIPWVGTGFDIDASGNLTAKTNGNLSIAKFFSFRFAEKFLGYAQKKIEPKTLEFFEKTEVSFDNPTPTKKPAASFVDNKNGTGTVTMTIANKWGDYPLTAYHFLVHIGYKKADGTQGYLIVRTDTLANSGYDLTSAEWSAAVKLPFNPVTLPANVDNASSKVVSDYDGPSVQITTKKSGFKVGYDIKLTFSYPTAINNAPHSSNPNFSVKKWAFKSQDANHKSANNGLPMNHLVVLDENFTLKDLKPVDSTGMTVF